MASLNVDDQTDVPSQVLIANLPGIHKITATSQSSEAGSILKQ